MPRKYESIYIGLAELLLELSDRPTYEEKGRFIEEVVKCVIKQSRGVNDYADSLMDQADEYREDNRRRQQEFRERQKSKNAPEAEITAEKADDEKPKAAAKTRKKKDDQLISDPEKQAFGPFENVFLTAAENRSLINRYGKKYDHAMEILSSYKKSSGKTYKSDFAAFYSWVDKRLAEEETAALKAENESKTFKQRDREDAAERVRASFPGIMQKFGLEENS